MNDILISQIEPERYFTQEVYLDEKYILLAPETPVPEDLLERLSRWGFDYLKTQGKQAEKPSTASQTAVGGDAPLTMVDQDIKDKQAMEDANKDYRNFVEFG